MLDESYQQALLRLPREAFDTAEYGLFKGYTYRARGDSVRFRAYYDTAFDAATAKLRKAPKFATSYLWVTCWVLASRGRRAEAYAAMAKARASMGVQYWQNFGELEARLAVIAGDSDRALDVLERGNWGPELTVPWLKADPFWDPLRRNPRFQRLLERKQ